MSRNNDTEHKMDNGVFKKGTHKRLSDAAQINLSRIAERDETQKLLKISADTIDERNIFDKYDDSRENSFEKEKEEKSKHAEKDKKNKVNKTKNERVIEDLGKREVYHGYEPECEKLAEEEIKTTKVSEKRHMDRVNKLEGNKSRVECEKSINKKSSAIELKLDLTKLRSETDSSDEMDIKQNDGKRNKSDGDSPINRDDLFFPGLKHTCKHGNINYTPRKGDTLYQSSSPGQKSDKIPRKCILCDINGASVRTKAVQTDSDKLLSELIYPYEFYDRFSRADKRQNEEKTKEVIPICQPVNVVQKPTTPKRMTPLIPVPASTPEISDKESMKESPLEAPKHSPVDTGEVEKEVRKEKQEKRVQYLYEPKENLKTEFHGDCGNTMNALVVTEHAEGHKRTLPGMKGYFQQQQKDAKSLQKAVKQCKYKTCIWHKILLALRSFDTCFYFFFFFFFIIIIILFSSVCLEYWSIAVKKNHNELKFINTGLFST